jgi:hypothetical protein
MLSKGKFIKTACVRERESSAGKEFPTLSESPPSKTIVKVYEQNQLS